MNILTRHTTSRQRNILGCIVAFLLSLLLGGIGIAIMVLREILQSRKGGFPIEENDIIRYTLCGTVATVLRDIILIVIT